MGSPDIYLSYSGPLDYKQIDIILVQLRDSVKFRDLEKIPGKRVYAVLVECMENILNHSADCPPGDKTYQPYVSVSELNDKVFISTGNLVSENKTDKIDHCLKKLNSLDNEDLAKLYEENITKKLDKKTNGSGLGCILMRRKSGNKLSYSFKNAYSGLTYFELQISIDKYHEKVNY